MCGFAGLIDLRRQYSADGLAAIATGMGNALVHRGPDDGGIWAEAAQGVAFSHRRLSILDLSPAGHQPMHSASGRFVIAFNGEIYNWPEVRQALEQARGAYAWRGHSDTEVLVEAIDCWGIAETLRRCRGMFALAVWDRNERCLYLARDRVGEKPLYYGRNGAAIVFGSELKALTRVPGWQGQTDPDALAQFLRYGYIPTPRSIYRGIKKLPPGTWVCIEADGAIGEPQTWWSFRQTATDALASPLALDDADALAALDETLRASVKEQMAADVPLGALLSGGIDSTAIVALMQAQSTRPVKTFTVGFDEAAYDESSHAAAVAAHLGTEHTTLRVTAAEAYDVIPRLPDMYDEPFGDSSQIPTYLVSALTRQHVTVCLSGDAGDELFGGYNRYFWATSIWRRLGSLPVGLRCVAAAMLRGMPANSWNIFFGLLFKVLPQHLAVSNPGDKMHKLAEVIAAASPMELYRLLVSQWRGPLPLNGISEVPDLVNTPAAWPSANTFSERMMAVDTLSYLPDDILVKVDRAAMAASLETRVPFLDPRVMELAWRLPLDQKIRNGEGKWLLKQLLYRYVPQEMMERPKQGFGVPIDHWLRGPLRDWAEDLLSESALREDGMLDPAPIRAMWKMHLEGRNVQYALWNVLIYQAWRRRWA